uniref:Uncharacterized protein n=1 Tax=Parascaris equorum TaxID=6256 RepID=A0A914R1T9_PAREQ
MKHKVPIVARLHKYRFDYRGDMTVDLCAELLARNLYYRRFFPYYTGSILAGIDEDGLLQWAGFLTNETRINCCARNASIA